MKDPWVLPFKNLQSCHREKHAKKKKKRQLLDRIKHVLEGGANKLGQSKMQLNPEEKLSGKETKCWTNGLQL